MTIRLDDENEDWLRALRQAKLEKQGWKGSVAEWAEACEALNGDPLARKPPITTLGDAKKAT